MGLSKSFFLLEPQEKALALSYLRHNAETKKKQKPKVTPVTIFLPAARAPASAFFFSFFLFFFR